MNKEIMQEYAALQLRKAEIEQAIFKLKREDAELDQKLIALKAKYPELMQAPGSAGPTMNQAEKDKKAREQEGKSGGQFV
jgi:hypothetical protein